MGLDLKTSPIFYLFQTWIFEPLVGYDFHFFEGFRLFYGVVLTTVLRIQCVILYHRCPVHLWENIINWTSPEKKLLLCKWMEGCLRGLLWCWMVVLDIVHWTYPRTGMLRMHQKTRGNCVFFYGVFVIRSPACLNWLECMCVHSVFLLFQRCNLQRMDPEHLFGS